MLSIFSKDDVNVVKALVDDKQNELSFFSDTFCCRIVNLSHKLSSHKSLDSRKANIIAIEHNIDKYFALLVGSVHSAEKKTNSIWRWQLIEMQILRIMSMT